MASVRFLRNLNLKVTYEGEDTMVPFSSGDIYTATKVEVDDEGFNDIHMPDGSVIKGVATEVFEHMGKLPVVKVKAVQPAPENSEIVVEHKPEAPVVLAGEMRSESEEHDDEPDDEDYFATTPYRHL